MRKPETRGPREGTEGEPLFLRVFKALSDPTRLEIFRLIERQRRTADELVDAFALSQPTLFRHLSVLKEAELVVDHQEGRVVRYGLNAQTLVSTMRALLEQFPSVQNMWGSGDNLLLLLHEKASDLNPDEVIDTAADIASCHPGLSGRETELRSLLAWESSKANMVRELAGGPRRLLTAAELEEELQVRIASEAVADIWQEEVLEPRQVAVALGAKETNREKVASLRRRSVLLGIPRDARYLYPAFQLDLRRRRIFPEVWKVNEVLGAADDPWGVASWWFATNDRLSARPADLVGSRRGGEVVEVAKAMMGPVG